MSDNDLKKAGLKATGPRIKILAILESSTDKHLSAEDIYKLLIEQGDEISLATVYRVLTQFEAAEILTRHNFAGGQSVFELNQEHHDHLVCLKCGKITEFIDELIEQQQHKIAQQNGFKITDHSLNIYGFCKNCK